MRFAAALLVVVSSTLAALIARQSLPNCAAPCVTNANAGTCRPADDVCLCKDKAFINSATACIESSCTSNDLQNAEAFVRQLCLAVDVTLTASSATATSPITHSSSATMTNCHSAFASAAVALAIAVVL